ncbi:MAG: hypothetical protein R2751_16410 [Bacteroidales bacterium]
MHPSMCPPQRLPIRPYLSLFILTGFLLLLPSCRQGSAVAQAELESRVVKYLMADGLKF